MATYIMGDIHGCYDELLRLLEKVQFDPARDRLITVGDVIGRGPREAETVAFFMRHGHEAVLGNHEWRLQRRAPGGPLPAWIDQVPFPREAVLQWIDRRPLFYETETFLVVHAGLHPDGRHPRDTDPALLTRIRTWDGTGQDLSSPDHPAWFEFYRGTKTVYFGHWAARGLVNRPLVKCLDSGCVYGGGLTCCRAEDGAWFSVKAARVYRPPNVEGHPWKFERGPGLAEEL